MNQLSVECSMLRGHTFFNFDLQNEITGQETHFSNFFSPLEFAGNNELYSQILDLSNHNVIGQLRYVTGQKYCVKNNSHTSEPDVILVL